MTDQTDLDNLSRGCEEFQQTIWRHYEPVFSEFGFELVEQKDAAGERCLLILESPDYRLRFKFDRGSTEVHAGRKDARALWTEHAKGSQEWFAMSTVLDYLAGRPKPSLTELMAQGEQTRAQSVEQRVVLLAEQVGEAAAEISRLFGRELSSDEWKAFVAYYADNQDLEKELTQKYGKRPDADES